MRLADQMVLRAEGSSSDPMAADWKAWAKAISGAACYEIDRTAGELSFGTTEHSIARTAEQSRKAAFPHKTCWFEWLGPSAKMGPRADAPAASGKIVPVRSGCLIQCHDGGQHGVMSWVWSMSNVMLEPNGFSMLFDWRQTPSPMPDLRRLMCAAHGVSLEAAQREVHARSRYAGQPFETMRDEENRFGTVPCGLMGSFWLGLAGLAIENPTLLQQVIQGQLDDIQGETLFIMGLLICMCADGLLDISETEDVTRLNIARRKRGRTELMPFRTVRASRRNVIRLSERGGQLETMSGVFAA